MTKKSVTLCVNVWWEPDTRRIKIAGDGVISWVTDKPDSERYHPNLFRKLATRLRDEGLPAPAMEKKHA